MADVEKSLKKMGLIIDRLVQKVEEMDRRLKALEEGQRTAPGGGKMGGEKVGAVSKGNESATAPGATGPSFGKTLGTSFLGSLAGAVAGMGLYNLLFNDDVAPQAMAEKMGVDTSALEGFALDGLEEKIEGLDEKLDELDKELDDMLAQVEEFDDGITDADFEEMSLDDYLASEEGGDLFDTDFGGDFGGGDFGSGFDDV
ncbi:MAG: hypothetical protein GXO19_01015 [Epsilonproteobacteria bacterium]|nr:hypothetical protein [Campylobacterota bacterium]NPA56294.1 hypothetical protein [Campylobacterota bacterium]